MKGPFGPFLCFSYIQNMSKDYKQVLQGYYDTEKKVKAVDLLTNQPYFIDDRPDMKQRIERAINYNQLLGVYQRGKRNGFEYIDNTQYEIKPVSTPKKPKNMNKPEDFFISDIKWKYLTWCINSGKNLLFVGPSGTGKTQVVFKAADALGREVFYFNLGSTQDPRSVLIGNTFFKNGTYFEESIFVKALKTPNAVILLDEISRANPEAWNILMPVLDVNIRQLRLDESDLTPTVTVADGVSFIATANVGFEYTSTRTLDKALIDRFNVVEMDTLDKTQEMKLLGMKFPNLNAYANEVLCDISDKVKKECQKENAKISSIISTRTLLEIAEVMASGFLLEEVAELIIYPLYSNDGGTDSERIYMRQLIQKYIQQGDKKDLFTDNDFRELKEYEF